MKTTWWMWIGAMAQILLAAGFWSIGEGARGSVPLTLGLWSLQQALMRRGRN